MATIFQASSSPYSVFPIRFPEIWKLYKQAVANFWTVEEVDLSSDDWNSLSKGEQTFLKRVLAFFATADGIVVDNLSLRFANEIEAIEAKMFYHFQSAMENIHNEAYSALIDYYIKDETEKNELFEAIGTIDSIRQKAEWAIQYIQSADKFATRLVAFAAVEGIFFSSSFAAIFWFKKRGMLPGLTFSNELIARDESLHTQFACHLYKNELSEKLSEAEVREIVSAAVVIEKNFVNDSLGNLAGMNATLMSKYVEFVADRLLEDLGHGKLYNTTNPFEWMEMISLQNKANFFESRVSSYQKAGIMESVGSETAFDDDF